jgi:hypothetical protein
MADAWGGGVFGYPHQGTKYSDPPKYGRDEIVTNATLPCRWFHFLVLRFPVRFGVTKSRHVALPFTDDGNILPKVSTSSH